MFLDEDVLKNGRSNLLVGTLVSQVVIFLGIIVSGARVTSSSISSSGEFGLSSAKLPVQSGEIAPTTVAFPGLSRESQFLELPLPELSDAPSRLPASNRLIAAEVQQGDSLARVLTRHGGTYRDAAAIAQALKAAGSSASSLRVGESLELEVSLEGEIVALRRRLGGGNLLTLERDLEGFSHAIIKPQILETEVAVSNIIQTNLSSSASQVSLPRAVMDEFVDLFGGSVEFNRDIRPGDSFSVIYINRETDSGDVLTAGPILAASLMIGGRFMAAIRHVDEDGKAQYYDADGHPLGGSFLRYPVRFSRISSVFTASRLHPVLNEKRPHNGVDFVAPVGTPVRVVADGVVTIAGRRGHAGIMVRVRHCNRYETEYLHLNKLGPGIRKGVRVSRGQHIGDVGKTGLVTGAHLHYGFFDNGRYVDPLKLSPNLLVSDHPKVPPKVLQAKVEQLQNNHQVLMIAATSESQAAKG